MASRKALGWSLPARAAGERWPRASQTALEVAVRAPPPLPPALLSMHGSSLGGKEGWNEPKKRESGSAVGPLRASCTRLYV